MKALGSVNTTQCGSSSSPMGRAGGEGERVAWIGRGRVRAWRNDDSRVAARILQQDDDDNRPVFEAFLLALLSLIAPWVGVADDLADARRRTQGFQPSSSESYSSPLSCGCCALRASSSSSICWAGSLSRSRT